MATNETMQAGRTLESIPAGLLAELRAHATAPVRPEEVARARRHVQRGVIDEAGVIDAIASGLLGGGVPGVAGTGVSDS